MHQHCIRRVWTASTLLICCNWRMRCPKNVNILGLAGFSSIKGNTEGNKGNYYFTLLFFGAEGMVEKSLLSRKIFALFSFSCLRVCLLQNTVCQFLASLCSGLGEQTAQLASTVCKSWDSRLWVRDRRFACGVVWAGLLLMWKEAGKEAGLSAEKLAILSH